MYQAVHHEFLVPSDGSFEIESVAAKPAKKAGIKKEQKKRLREYVEQLEDYQRRLYAEDKHAVLLVFQAMDAAGKDSTIRSVLTGVNPAGCQVFSFKQPNSLELDHDFLWRTTLCLPQRGMIGVFNRSYYEEVLVARVHPKILAKQRMPFRPEPTQIWQERFESIRTMEKHLARNGTLILKFWLNVSPEEQKARFISRIDDKRKNWKFSQSDVTERAHWKKYMEAYQDCLNQTSRSWAPWYAIPADNKPFMRATVAEIVVENVKQLNPSYPKRADTALENPDGIKEILEKQDIG